MTIVTIKEVIVRNGIETDENAIDLVLEQEERGYLPLGFARLVPAEDGQCMLKIVDDFDRPIDLTPDCSVPLMTLNGEKIFGIQERVFTSTDVFVHHAPSAKLYTVYRQTVNIKAE